MTRLSFSSFIAATLLACFTVAPANAQNVTARWGYNPNGFVNGPNLTGIRSTAVSPRSHSNAIHRRVSAANTSRAVGRYNVFRDRSGFGLRQTRVTVNSGWGCPTCGFKNSPELSGLRQPPGPVVLAVTLPSGDIIDLR